MEFSLVNNMLIINEIRLKNKRVGTLTDIVDYFKNIDWGIYIISVLTEEMHSFCKKYGFERQEGGIGYGNFIKKGCGGYMSNEHATYRVDEIKECIDEVFKNVLTYSNWGTYHIAEQVESIKTVLYEKFGIQE